jgi:hypothetical protein
MALAAVPAVLLPLRVALVPRLAFGAGCICVDSGERAQEGDAERRQDTPS